jgi:hypothetical protein
LVPTSATCHVAREAGRRHLGDVVRAAAAHVELDVRRERQQRQPRVARQQVVQGQPVPRVDQVVAALHDVRVGVGVREHLEHHSVGPEGQRQLTGEERAGDVDEGQPRADQRPDPELRERVHDDVGGGEVGLRLVEVGGVGGRAGAEQQLVPAHLQARVEDRLAADMDGVLRHGVLPGSLASRQWWTSPFLIGSRGPR